MHLKDSDRFTTTTTVPEPSKGLSVLNKLLNRQPFRKNKNTKNKKLLNDPLLLLARDQPKDLIYPQNPGETPNLLNPSVHEISETLCNPWVLPPYSNSLINP